MLSVDDVLDILAIPLLGVIPEDESVLKASNMGVPVIFYNETPPGQAYADAVGRYLGEVIEHRLHQPQKIGFFQRLLGRPA